MPPEELPVLLHDRLPAYISWDRYLANQERLEQNRSLHDTTGVPKRGAALLQGLVVCGKCNYHMATHYNTDKRPSYYCGENSRSPLDEYCGYISSATLGRFGREGSAPRLGARDARSQLTSHRKRRAGTKASARPMASDSRTRPAGSRESRAAVPSRGTRESTRGTYAGGTLGGRAEETTQAEEDYHRFLLRLPATLNVAERQRIQSLSKSVATLWNAPETSSLDRKQIIRCIVDRVIVVVDKSTEFNEVTIVWLGGVTTKHQVARPVGKYEQLKDYRLLTERVTQLHGEGLHLAQIAKRLNDEGFVPPRRRGAFTEATIADFVRNLGLVGELFRADLVAKDEWWIPDLAEKLGVISQKIHYWVRQAWVHSRRTPSGKYLIVWADKDEIRRLKRLAKRKNSWIAARHPELVIPKARPGR